MLQALNNLLSLLSLEKIEDGFFRGQSEDIGLGHIFGGQVISQALCAAKATVSTERLVHSFHSYFLRLGNTTLPVLYEVETLRDGNSLSARRISAIQHGKPIFYMTASFQAEEKGLNHQQQKPDALGPRQLPSELAIAHSLEKFLPPAAKEKFLNEKPFEFRPVVFHNPLKGHIDEPVRQVWVRANGTLPNVPALHQALLGYVSDFHFLPTALQPHGIGFLEAGMQVATVDHAMWFHRAFTLNDWLLYHIESPSASGGRGFVRGAFYTQEGILVASSAQEGIIRQRHLDPMHPASR